MPEVRIGVAQLAVTSIVEQNLANILSWMQRAHALGIQILCLPEYCLNPRFEHWTDLTVAIQQIQAACRRYDLWCSFGAESGSAHARQNSTYLVEPTGAIRYRYDKVHLWQNEKAHFIAGQTTQVIDIGICRIGIICCWDIAFPAFVAKLAQQGAEIIFCPSYLCDYTKDQQALRALPLARAFENGIYFALCDAFTPETLSESYLCHPQRVQQSIIQQEGLIACDVDRAELSALRQYYGYTTQEPLV